MINEFIQQILREMLNNKLRSLLALFGIMWGTAAVILLLALGYSYAETSQKNMRGFINGTLIFSIGNTANPYHGQPSQRTLHIKADDILHLKTAISEIKLISPVLFKDETIQQGHYHMNSFIQGVANSYDQLEKIKIPAQQRFFDSLDIQANRFVIFIGPGLKNALFPKQNAIHEMVMIAGVPFRVIGVMEEIPNAGHWYDNAAYIPYSSYITLWGNQDVHEFAVLGKDLNHSKQLTQAITHYLSSQYQFDPTDQSALHVFDMSKVFNFFKLFFLCIEIFLGACGAMTLAVGGLSVANFMFLVITERTHEFGLRMSLGAEAKHILHQVILETAIIVAMGGLGGFLLAEILILILQAVTLPHWLGTPHLSYAVALIAILVLAMTALAAGYFPARRAARLQPVVALNATTS